MLSTDRTLLRSSPLTEDVHLLQVETSPDDTVHVSSQVCMDPGNPIFAGHYPGLALVPGVCLIEFVHRTVLMTASLRDVSLALDTVVRARFLDPVFPGEDINAKVMVVPGVTHWDAKATVNGGRGAAARITLRYRPSAGA